MKDSDRVIQLWHDINIGELWDITLDSSVSAGRMVWRTGLNPRAVTWRALY